jgi:hypothetical protein
VSSRIDHSTAEVVITAPIYATMPVGHRLRVCGVAGFSVSGQYARQLAAFDDYLARLALSRQPVRVDAVRVLPPEGTLLELVERGVVHESLVEKPRVAA